MLDRYDEHVSGMIGGTYSNEPEYPHYDIANTESISAKELLNILSYVDLTAFDDYDLTSSKAMLLLSYHGMFVIMSLIMMLFQYRFT